MSASKKAKTNTSYDDINDKYMLLVNALEPREPKSYRFSLNDAPECLKLVLLRSGKRQFEMVYFDDGAEGADGLVAEGDREDDDAKEVEDYFIDKSNFENKLVLPFNGSIDFVVHLAHA